MFEQLVELTDEQARQAQENQAIHIANQIIDQILEGKKSA